MFGQNRVTWGRSLVMFIVAWLVGVYVYDVVRQDSGWFLGLALAVATFVVNAFARWRALKSVGDARWQFHFWTALPFVLFFIVPLGFKIVAYVRSAGEVSWWQHFVALLPFLLKLGVPVVALLWVYLILGRLGGDRNAGPSPVAS